MREQSGSKKGRKYMEPGQVQDTIGGGQAWLEAEGMERCG